MADICKKCGLPKDLCVCQEIAKGGQKIKVTIERKRYRKYMTVIEGLDSNTDFNSMAKEFKKKLACGGTVKGGKIELQGDHRNKVKKMLLNMNFSEDQIDVY